MKNIIKRNIARAIIITTTAIVTSSSFAANLTPFVGTQGKKLGLKNSAGKEVVSPKYDGINHFKNGYAIVTANNLWGFVNENGKEVVPTIYDGVSEFLNGYAPVKKDGKWGIVNTSGERVISLNYEQVSYFDSDSNVYAKKDGKWGKLDRSENIVVPFLYDKIDQNTKPVLSSSKVTLDGEEIVISAYNIDNNNYVKIRDFAKLLDGSKRQFEVIWDSEKRIINLISNKPYSSVGGELAKITKNANRARFVKLPIDKDGESITIKGYTIDNNSYFKIRDLAKEFNIGINWNQNTKTMGISTMSGYTE